MARGRVACALLVLPLIARAVDLDVPRSLVESDTPLGAVGVSYLTNRTRYRDGPNSLGYGDGRGTPRVGRCTVEFSFYRLLPRSLCPP
jgi:hypothetical protein